MDVKCWRFCILVCLILCGQVSLAASSKWADAVVSFDQPAGSYDDGHPAGNAVGPVDAKWVSIDLSETLIVAFTDNSCMDGFAVDLVVIGGSDFLSFVDVYGSKNNVDYTYLGRINSTEVFDIVTGLDIAGKFFLPVLPDLTYVNYVKFVGVDDNGTPPGFRLDAVMAWHSGAYIPNGGPCPIPAPGAAMLAGLGVALLAARRRPRPL